MIEASFDRNAGSSAVALGAYQYDTGQRLRMHGLPSPEELAQGDTFLSGDAVTVQVHYGMKGDSQTLARLAVWNEEERCYVASIPDVCLQNSESVYAYVYVSYGIDEKGNGRTKTMYELTIYPVGRPAPNNVATSEQWEAWAVKAQEIDLAIDSALTAREGAQAGEQTAREAQEDAALASEDARQAQQDAEEAAERLKEEEERWSTMGIQTISLQAGCAATADLSGDMIAFGIPMGQRGAKGETGDTGPDDIALTMADGVLTITTRG